MEYKKKMLICDDTMEGIFTAVYDGWRWGNRGFSVGIAVREPDYPELFTENLEIISDSVKAFKVARTIKTGLADRFMKQCAMLRHLFIRKRERQFFICFAERWKREGLIRGYWKLWQIRR